MLCSYWNNPVSPLLWQHPLHKFVPPPFEVDHMTGRDGPKMHTVVELFNRYREFFMATLQPVICLVEKKENSPFFRIFLQCLLDYRHIFETIFFVAVFNARECFQAINKIDNIGNLIFRCWDSAMSIILLSVYLLKKLLKQLKKKIFSRTMALENLERLLRELEMKTSTPRWVIKIPYCRFWVHDLEPVDSFCGQRTEKVLALRFLLESTSILDDFESLWWRFNMS